MQDGAAYLGKRAPIDVKSLWGLYIGKVVTCNLSRNNVSGGCLVGALVAGSVTFCTGIASWQIVM